MPAQPARLGLRVIGDVYAELRAATEQMLKGAEALGRRDHEDVAHARAHQQSDGMEDHRHVVDREQLLGDDACRRQQPRSPAAG